MNRPTPRPHPAWLNGFTLIELLVVVGVIALLIAILLPVLGAARRTGKTAVCASNLRTLGQATMMYTTDFDRYLPQPFQNGNMASAIGGVAGQQASGRAMWFNALDYYLEQIKKNYQQGISAERNYVQFKHDPAWLDIPEGGLQINATLATRENQQTLKMNENLGVSQSGTWKSFRISDLPAPQRTVLFLDGRAFDTPSATSGNIDGGSFSAGPGLVGLRHQNGANVAKADGSVALHQNNARQVSAAGYTGWYTETTANQANWPDVIFDWQNRKF